MNIDSGTSLNLTLIHTCTSLDCGSAKSLCGSSVNHYEEQPEAFVGRYEVPSTAKSFCTEFSFNLNGGIELLWCTLVYIHTLSNLFICTSTRSLLGVQLIRCNTRLVRNEYQIAGMCVVEHGRKYNIILLCIFSVAPRKTFKCVKSDAKKSKIHFVAMQVS